MRTIVLAALVMVLILHAGCATPPTVSEEQLAALAQREDARVFNWRVYEGKGDPATAVYVLGDTELGEGDEGLLNFERVIHHAPAFARYRIGQYYSPFDRSPRAYPMDDNPIWERILAAARNRNIAIVYPTLLSQP